MTSGNRQICPIKFFGNLAVHISPCLDDHTLGLAIIEFDHTGLARGNSNITNAESKIAVILDPTNNPMYFFLNTTFPFVNFILGEDQPRLSCLQEFFRLLDPVPTPCYRLKRKEVFKFIFYFLSLDCQLLLCSFFLFSDSACLLLLPSGNLNAQ